MHILIVGLNHKASPVQLREKLHFSSEELPQALDQLLGTKVIQEAVILSTCNRVEIIVTSYDKQSAQEVVINFLANFHHLDRSHFESFLYIFSDERALDHLFRVACGLDSLVFGEVEILGQVKEAFRLSCEKESIGPYLLKLQEKTYEVAKRVRSQTQIGKGATSVASASVELAEKIFGQLKGETVMVLGTGEMSTQALKYLTEAGCGSIIVSSRNFEKAVDIAKQFHAQAVSFENWLTLLPTIDIVLCSTSAPHYLLTVDQMKVVMDKRRHKPTFLIDISVPRNLDPKINELDDVYLYNIDDLKVVCESNLKIRQAEWPHCVQLVEQGVQEFFQWEKSLQLGPLVKVVSDYFDQISESEIKRLNLQSDEEIKQWYHVMRRVKLKFMHQPLERLKEAASNGGFHLYLDTLHQLFQKKDISEKRDSEKQSHKQ